MKLLGLVRPIDNNDYDFGLAQGIAAHLKESVKLCGLRKAREKSILDMIGTLCRHLARREEELARWSAFADEVPRPWQRARRGPAGPGGDATRPHLRP